MRNIIARVGRMFFLILPLSFVHVVHAGPSLDFPRNFADFATSDIKTTIANIVRIIIGFLGILIVVAIIYGGVKMMMSGGDADKMGEGRKVVVSGAIGLIITLAAYAIANFVIQSLNTAL